MHSSNKFVIKVVCGWAVVNTFTVVVVIMSHGFEHPLKLEDDGVTRVWVEDEDAVVSLVSVTLLATIIAVWSIAMMVAGVVFRRFIIRFPDDIEAGGSITLPQK